MKTILTILLALSSRILFAQSSSIPMDTSVRFGKLKNGITYYIKSNDFHKGYADFQMFHAVGAIQEEDNQNGLAHFLEHMAFKGLKHFPGQSLINYMERLGVKFGANLNASTTTDYTRYMMNGVPLSRQSIIDSCLMVLTDWSGSISATAQDIETERGIIQEEWRTRTGSDVRIGQALAPFYFKGSKYADRSVIGDMNIIQHFKRDELLDFYHKWYRPDLQAVAIVGDFDADKMEKAVIKQLSKIPTAKNPVPKKAYKIPDNTKLIYGTVTDKEIANPSISLLIKHNNVAASIKNSKEGYVHNFVNNVLIWMMNRRWNEIADNKELILKNLNFSYGSFEGDKDVFSVGAEVKTGNGNILPAIDSMLYEAERFRRYGFTKEELELAKLNFGKQIERRYAERNQRSNQDYVQRFFENFIEHKPVISSEESYTLLKQAVDTLSLDAANFAVRKFFKNDNQIMIVVAPEAQAKEIPSEKTVASKLAHMPKSIVTRYTSPSSSQLTPSQIPKAGSIVGHLEGPFGSTIWKLSNGATIYLLPTDYKKEEILFEAFNTGGLSTLNDNDFYSGRLVSSAVTASGVGRLTSAELSRTLTGKVVYVTPYFNEFYKGFSGATTPSDLEASLKLLYMYFTEPRFEKEDFDLMIKKIKDNLEARKKNPFSALQDSVFLWRENLSPRASSLILNPKEADRVDFDKVISLYKRAFANPGDFSFVFTGAFDTAIIKPLIEKYIGGLNGIHREDNWKDIGKRPPLGEKTIDFKNKMETPKSTVFMEYTAFVPYSVRKASLMQIIQGVLETRMKVILRDENSGVYTPQIESRLHELPVGKLSMIISFDTKPELIDNLIIASQDEVKRLAKEGVTSEDFEKSREYLIKSYSQGFTNNSFWQYVLSNYAKTGRDQYTGYIDMLRSLDPQEATSLLQELVEKDNLLKIIMRPE